MKRSSWLVLVLVLALAALTVYLKVTGAPQLTEEEQVKQMLTEGEAAIEDRDLHRAMSYVSPEYKDSYGTTRDGIRIQVIQAFRSTDGFDVTLQNADVSVKGDTAQVNADVSVDAIQNGERSGIVDTRLTLNLRKEEGTRWIFLRTKRWRLISLSGIPTGFDEG